MDQLRRWVHRHSDASSPPQGGRSAGSLGGAAIISRCSGGAHSLVWRCRQDDPL